MGKADPVNYRGYDICEIPPNGDGIIALMALNILKGYSFTDRSCVDTVHKQLEAMKLAFADGNRYVADPGYMRAPVETLLSDEYAAERRSLIGEMAQDPEPGDPFRGGTISARRTGKETWSPTSRATIWDLAPAS